MLAVELCSIRQIRIHGPRTKLEEKKMRTALILCLLLVGAIYDQAAAAPDCWGVIALNNLNQKVARITCSDDGAPGSANSYACSFSWKVRGATGTVETWSSNFTCVRGEQNALKYENSRLMDGSQLDDEVDGVSIPCNAQ
jgi:hypothetical protein